MSTLRDAWRSIRATPRLTVTAAACAALGLAAAVFMTALVDAVLLSAPPIPDAERLVRVWTSSTTSRETSDISHPEFLDVAARVGSLEDVAAAARTRLAVTTDDGTERVRGESVTANYFEMTGVRPALGRLFDAREYAPDGDRVVVISHALWQRRFGGQDDVVGQPFRTRPTSRQSGAAVRTIVGVMPPGFIGTVDPDVSDFWVPMAHFEPAPLLGDRLARNVWVIGRLRAGVSLATVQSEVAAVAAALAKEHPQAYDRVTLVAEPFGESWRARFRLSLVTLAVAAGLLLLIACTNVATLLMARLAAREEELHLRAALGASRARLAGQLLCESLLIAVAGGVAGLVVASVTMRLVAAAGLFALPPYVTLALEPRAAVAGLGLVVLTGLLFGVLPARAGAGADASLAGRDTGTRVSQSRSHRRHGRALVVAQVSFTFVLLVGAVLLLRTYQNLTGGDLGFRQVNLLRLAVSPDPNAFPAAGDRVALAEEIRRTLDAYPGVRQTSVISGVLQPWFDDVTDVLVGGGEPVRNVGRHAVDRAYFDVMDIPVVEGRGFGPEDRAEGSRSGLVSQSLARLIEQVTGRSALGQAVATRMPGMPGEEVVDVIGVVGDVTYHGPLNPRAADYDVWLPIERDNPRALSIAVHTDVAAASLIEPLTRELGRLAPTSPQHWISTMEDELALQYRDPRLYASLSGVYGVSAALVALFGIYSVLANGVVRRHREFGVRMAVGAGAADVMRIVMVEGAATIGVGLAIGAGLALGVTRLLGGLLYGVVPADPWSFAVVAAGLVAGGLAACAIPSLRAARIDPLSAIRST